MRERIQRVGVSICLFLLLIACSAQHNRSKPTEPEQKQEQTLSRETLLRRLSLHLRGKLPSRDEYHNLRVAQQENSDLEFLRERIRRYLRSDEYINKMTFRLEELFFLKNSREIWSSLDLPNRESELASEPYDYYIKFNSLNELFRRILLRNLSWDNLLLAKSYVAYARSSGMFLGIDDVSFLKSAYSRLDGNQKGPQRVQFDPHDPRVAGALTTSRFFNRYTNSVVNKNRRRAAAVFRIFLCDDMQAAIVNERGNQTAILEKVFPATHFAFLETSMEDSHGRRQDCMKCHYKLDPYGKTFRTSGLSLSPFASSGHLVYRRSSGELVSVQGEGIGDLAKAITLQSEYEQCQVSHFWQWFIGADVPLTKERRQTLVAEFNRVGRRANDFVKYLVTQPEFGCGRLILSKNSLNHEVQMVLKNCSSCHAERGDPDFSLWPIGGTRASHLDWVVKISNSLQLENRGIGRTMPPKEFLWQPSKDELKAVKEWVDGGAVYASQ